MECHRTPKPSQIVEVEIERIVPGGRGLGHAAGLTLFVAMTAPGDVVRVRIDEVRGRIGFATVVEVVQPAAGRVEAACAYFGVCGGCDWQHLNYEAQLDAKREIIADCLRRIARIVPPDDLQVVPSPSEWGYRSRAVWRLDPAKRRLGYYEEGSHRIRDVETCLVLTPRLQEELTRARRDIAQGAGTWQARELRVAAVGERVASQPPLRGAADELTCVVRGEPYTFDAASFFQTNLTILDALVEYVMGVIGEGRSPNDEAWALDLYCGVGFFTLPLARSFPRVVGVEASRRAVAFARRNLTAAGLRNATIAAADVGDWLATQRATRPVPDIVVLDPPRTGMTPHALTKLIAWRPPRLTYVSCDPATLARDLRQLIAAGYRLGSVAGFDMFPQTHHVETVAQLLI